MADSSRLGQTTNINDYHFYVNTVEDEPSLVHIYPNPFITGSTRTGSLCRNLALRSSKVAVQGVFLTIVEPTMALHLFWARCCEILVLDLPMHELRTLCVKGDTRWGLYVGAAYFHPSYTSHQEGIE